MTRQKGKIRIESESEFQIEGIRLVPEFDRYHAYRSFRIHEKCMVPIEFPYQPRFRQRPVGTGPTRQPSF